MPWSREKLQTVLESNFGRLDACKGGATIRQEERH